MQRNKGASGEREIAGIVRDLTGRDVRRRVRQHDGDSGLEGVPSWSVEVKRHRSASRGDIAGWWRQTVEQAERAGAVPVLFFRADRDTWRAVWPLAALLTHQAADYWRAYEWTAKGAVAAWVAAARESRPIQQSVPGRREAWASSDAGAASLSNFKGRTA